MKMFSLKNKIAIVTGALGLLGKEHCKALSEAGANIAVCDLDEKKCSEFADELATESAGFSIDVTNKESIISVKDKVIEKFGSVDVLINNAAINDMLENPKADLSKSKFENYPIELWQQSIDVNLTGVFLCSQVLGSFMSENCGGSIVNIASTYGLLAPDQKLYQDELGNQLFYKPPAYIAAKGGVIALTKYLAAYWGEKKVRVNTLSPGGVENNQDDYFVKKYSSKTPLGRMAKPIDYKGAVVFLASDASSYMTGANLIIDGGWTCW